MSIVTPPYRSIPPKPLLWPRRNSVEMEPLELRRGITTACLFLMTLAGATGAFYDTLSRPSILLTSLGIAGLVLQYIAQWQREKDLQEFVDIQAALHAEAGHGNPYTIKAVRRVVATGCMSATEFHELETALSLHPDDEEAYAFLAAGTALGLSYHQWAGTPVQNLSAHIASARRFIDDGLARYPASEELILASGILYDVDGNHEEARACFSQVGKLQGDARWRIYSSVSWAMSGDLIKALADIDLAQQGGIDFWFVDLYRGRYLMALGRFPEARHCLYASFARKKWSAQLLQALFELHHNSGEFGHSSRIGLRLAARLSLTVPNAAIRSTRKAIFDFFLWSLFKLSKAVWRITRHYPRAAQIHCRIFSPTEPEAKIGLLMMTFGNYEQALRVMLPVAEQFPGVLPFQMNIASCLSMLGRHDDAIETARSVMQQNPKSALAERQLDSLRYRKEHAHEIDPAKVRIHSLSESLLRS